MGIPRPGWLTPKLAGLLSSLLVLLVALAVWWLEGGGATTTGEQPTRTAASSATPATPDAPATSEAPEAPVTSAPGTTQAAQPTASATAGGGQVPAVHPESGLPYVALSDLPPEAARTVELIEAGGPFPYDQDEEAFGNYEGLLPEHEHGYYREYTVETPGLDHRGARRIVAGADGTLYWTEDHYESFEVIWR